MNNRITSINSEIVLNVTRMLILLAKFNNQKSVKITLDKIMLYDFYMKYPSVMVDQDKEELKIDFSDYYSFYHWKPDRELYHQFLRYLVSKKLISRVISSNEFCYIISDAGLEVVNSLNSSYAQTLVETADYIKKNISRLSDSKIESEIINKSFKNRRLQIEGKLYG
ncbi:ABC-three component system middle component 2 [Paenibacillus alba]|uniref:Uncharacterized protein n=1 Tax=Paenibacillus alba TaxID=1197127 RepID=A0ABU6G3N9_9BACL|nr:ABC-three component system middle component 2 [Paenibacillus alba]MEC0228746.1 hypothetical protein [Paenibacillus alba]